jgi:hypothetical protein
MKKTILMTFLQRDTVRSTHPELWRQCLYLGTGRVSRRQYTWRYSTTVESALALRLMGLCFIEEQEEGASGW